MCQEIKKKKSKTKEVFFSHWLLYVMLLLSANTAYSQDALIVHGRDVTRHVSIALDNVQRITFSGNDLSVKPFDGNAAVYALDHIVKITFGNMEISDVTNPVGSDLDVVVYVTPAGEIVIESPVAIQSVTLIAMDGKILRRTDSAVETLHATSLQTTINVSNLSKGVYLLQIDTTQGTVVKKIINY